MSRPVRIMVVEDDEELNEVLQYNLSRAGYQVQPVHDGKDAMEQLEQSVPNLVLLDIMLPGADGWEVFAFMSRNPLLAEVPVIIFTAKSAREDFDRARQFKSFAGYFVKPYATQDVLRHVEKVLTEGPG